MGDLFLKRTADKLSKLNTDSLHDSSWLKMSLGAEYSLAKRRGLNKDAEIVNTLRQVVRRMK